MTNQFEPWRATKPLTEREIECLRWTAEGKTSWEVGVILSLSESAVNKHIMRAVEKLNCSNKIHAVAVGLRSGII